MNTMNTMKESPATTLRETVPISRYGRLAFAILGLLALVSLFLWSARPAFYYMEFALLILLAPLALGGIILLVWLYRKQKKRPEFPALTPLFILTGVLLLALLVSLPFQAPMRLAFLTAKPALEEAVAQWRTAGDSSTGEELTTGLYSFQGATSNPKRNPPGALIFRFKSDHEQAFIHSPEGIENLSYNSGTKGHLIGDWYWMCED